MPNDSASTVSTPILTRGQLLDDLTSYSHAQHEHWLRTFDSYELAKASEGNPQLVADLRRYWQAISDHSTSLTRLLLALVEENQEREAAAKAARTAEVVR